MLIVSGIVCCILVLYLFIIISFIYGWNKLKIFKSEDYKSQTKTSVIVAFRNEEKNLEALLRSLANQNLQSDNIEFLFVDDHSMDTSKNILLKFCTNQNNFKLLELPEGKTGKKAAIAFGVDHANGELIITTDADCYMNKNWLQTLVAYYDKYKPALISAPVIMSKNKTWFSDFQAVEFLSLIGSGAGAIGINRPIMCNAANMAFNKQFYLEKKDVSNAKFISGDDVFLLLSIKKMDKKQIHFIKSIDSIVYSHSQKTWKEFLNQRMRWISKSTGYRDFDIGFISVIVYFMNLMIMFLAVLSFFNIQFLIILLISLLIKSAVDSIFLNILHKYFYRKYILTAFKLHQLMNILVTSIIPLITIFSSFQWKERKYYK